MTTRVTEVANVWKLRGITTRLETEGMKECKVNSFIEMDYGLRSCLATS